MFKFRNWYIISPHISLHIYSSMLGTELIHVSNRAFQEASSHTLKRVWNALLHKYLWATRNQWLTPSLSITMTLSCLTWFRKQRIKKDSTDKLGWHKRLFVPTVCHCTDEYTLIVRLFACMNMTNRHIFSLLIHATYHDVWIAGSLGDASMGSLWLAWSEADVLPFFFSQYSDAVRDGNRTTNNPENNVGDHSKFDAVLGCECPRLKCSRGHDDRGTQYIKRLLLAQDGHHGTSPSLVTELYNSLNFPQRRFFYIYVVRDSDSQYLNNWYNVQSRIRLKFS